MLSQWKKLRFRNQYKRAWVQPGKNSYKKSYINSNAGYKTAKMQLCLNATLSTSPPDLFCRRKWITYKTSERAGRRNLDSNIGGLGIRLLKRKENDCPKGQETDVRRKDMGRDAGELYSAKDLFPLFSRTPQGYGIWCRKVAAIQVNNQMVNTKRAPTSSRTSGLIRLATTYSRTTAGSYYHRRLRA